MWAKVVLNFAVSESPGEILNIPVPRLHPHQLTQDLWRWGLDI